MQDWEKRLADRGLDLDDVRHYAYALPEAAIRELSEQPER